MSERNVITVGMPMTTGIIDSRIASTRYAGNLLLCAVLAIASLFPDFSIAGEIQGKVIRVLDGDTIEVLQDKKPVRIRLANIDAPEKKQAFGRWSTNQLKSLIAAQPVTVTYTQTATGGLSGTCSRRTASRPTVIWCRLAERGYMIDIILTHHYRLSRTRPESKGAVCGLIVNLFRRGNGGAIKRK